MRRTLFGVITLILSVSIVSFADDVITVTSEGKSSIPVAPKAKIAALKDAQEKASLDEITKIIGAAKLEKNRPLVLSKILPQSSKYIVITKPGEPVVKEGETTVSVFMKINLKNLRDLLGQSGLLYQSEGPGTVLPLIALVEKREKGRSYRWWIEEVNPQNSFLRDDLKNVIKDMDAAFRAKGFYMIDPVNMHYVQIVPDAYRNANLTLDDVLWLGQFFKAQMVISGEVEFEPAPTNSRAVQMDLKLTAYHAANGRVVGEVNRKFESTPQDWDMALNQVVKKGFEDATKDLSAQVFEQWARGTFGAALLKIRVSGNLDYKDLEAFKKQVTQNISDIKTLRERRLESGLAVFEVDAAGGMGNLVKRLEQTSFTGYVAQISNVESAQLDLRWKRK